MKQLLPGVRKQPQSIYQKRNGAMLLKKATIVLNYCYLCSSFTRSVEVTILL